MNRNTKIALGILGGILLICICLGASGLFLLGSFGRTITRSIKTDPTEIAQIAGNIAQFNTPPDYKVSAMSILGIDMLVITPTYPGMPIFMMMQYPTTGFFDSDQFQTQIERSFVQQYFGQGITFRNVGHTTANIRGQKIDFQILEGTPNNGKTVKEEIGAFQGNKGPVFLSILGERNSWDQATVDYFLQSIR